MLVPVTVTDKLKPVYNLKADGEYFDPRTGETSYTELQRIKVDYKVSGTYQFDKFLLDLIDPQIYLKLHAMLIDEKKEDYKNHD